MKTKWREIIAVVIALLLISLVISGFSAWDNDKPSDNQSWNTAMRDIRYNWDAFEVVFGIDLAESHPYYQAAAPTTKPDGSTSFDSDDLGRIWVDSDNNAIYVLTATTPTWTAVFISVANDTYFTAIDNAGTGTVNLIKANTSDVAVLPDGSELATSGAPTADADLANKKYVDDNVGSANYTPAVMTGSNDSIGSVTFPNGLIMKWGKINRSGTDTTVTFAAAFPNACFQAFACSGVNALILDDTSTYNITASSFVIQQNDATATDLRWQAMGR